MAIVILSLVAVTVISWLAIGWLVGELARRNIVDTPNDRSLHSGAIPRGGGLVIIAMVLLAIIVIGLLSERYQMFAALFISVLAWAGLSWADDYTDLSPRFRTAVQCLFALITIAAFGYVDQIQFSSDLLLPISVVGAVLSLIGIVWLANLYNFMDGMDGLAASQTIIAASTIGIWFWQYGDQSLGLVCFVLAAASYAFLLWNWQPAKIFMGDVGAITIGAFFATLLIIGVVRYEIPVISFVLLLAVFVADASVTVLCRIAKREKFWLPHRTHHYQRLANIGIAHNKIVIGLIALMLICSLIASITVADRDTINLGVALVLVLLVSSAIVVVYLESKYAKD